MDIDRIVPKDEIGLYWQETKDKCDWFDKLQQGEKRVE